MLFDDKIFDEEMKDFLLKVEMDKDGNINYDGMYQIQIGLGVYVNINVEDIDIRREGLYCIVIIK